MGHWLFARRAVQDEAALRGFRFPGGPPRDAPGAGQHGLRAGAGARVRAARGADRIPGDHHRREAVQLREEARLLAESQ